jgi:transposase
LAGTATVIPKGGDGPIEALRVLRVARVGARKARTAGLNTLRSMVITAPATLREQLGSLRSGRQLLAACLSFRPDLERIDDPLQATRLALRAVARRVRDLEAEIDELDRQIDRVLAKNAPATFSTFALGRDTAAALLVAIGDNPDRLRSEGAFARLCGVAPIPASSGNTRRHRLHRGGNRSANQALHVAVVVRMRYCTKTRAYVARRTREGLSKPEIIRCLKRHLAREVFQALRTDYASMAQFDL